MRGRSPGVATPTPEVQGGAVEKLGRRTFYHFMIVSLFFSRSPGRGTVLSACTPCLGMPIAIKWQQFRSVGGSGPRPAAAETAGVADERRALGVDG